MERYAILGLGRFGQRLAKEFGSTDADILAIDRDEERVEALADQVDTAVIADICDSDVLAEAGVTEHHVAIVAVEHSVEASALCVLALKDIGCGRIVALAATDAHARILKALGAEKIIMPEAEAALRFAQQEQSEADGDADTDAQERTG